MSDEKIIPFPKNIHLDFSKIKMDDLDDETKKSLREIASSKEYQEYKKNKESGK